MSKFNEILKAKAEYDKLVKDLGAKEIGAHVMEVLKDLDPRIKGITWKQYVPYFNDGESCTFGVHDPEILLDRGTADPEDVEEGDGEDPDGWDRIYSWYFSKYPDLQASMVKLRDAVTDIPEDVLEAAFGEHAEIRITRSGVDYDEYADHD